MEQLKNRSLLYRIYAGVGMAAVAVMAFCVIVTVIFRYVFSISFAFVEEFITAVFTFTTFWAIGICIIENEHIVIDFVYEKMPNQIKYVFSIINYLLMLLTSIVFLYFSIKWVQMVGDKLSAGMKIPSWMLYSIQPIGIGLSIVCIIVKLINVIQKHRQCKFDEDSAA